MTDRLRIQLEDIESSTIGAIGYDAHRQILAIRYKTKRQIRHYAGVSPQVAEEFYCALSKGQYFNQHIKGQYSVEQQTGDCPKCGDHGWIGDTCENCGCAPYAETPKPILHFVFHDEPSATSKRNQKAACGLTVSVRDVARRDYAVTCEGCKAARAAYEAAQPF